MTKLKPVLGRGLASLIPRPLPVAEPRPPETRSDDGSSTEVIVSVELNSITRNPFQPRADFDPVALDELKQSIQEKGIIQPITVRRVGDEFQLISGERRVRAAREAGLTRIPAYVIRVDSNEEMLELALIENLQREHLNPIEIAISYKRLIEECSLTQEQVSRRIGKDRTTITNTLRLLKLPESIQRSVRNGEMSSGHARALLAIEDTALQLGISQQITRKELSVRQVERLVRAQSGKKKIHTLSTGPSGADTSFSGVEDRFRQVLGTQVHVRPLQSGKGEIVVEYYSLDDLERLLEIFDGPRNQSYV
jgi:ParB family chromosome partitioning protein